MLFSIIVPVYNLENYISQCMDSLLNQDISEDEYEIIVVDDGSTDKSRDILDKYAEKYSNIEVFHKLNGGVSSARNVALDIARGEYIWFVDGDDLVATNVLATISAEIKKKNFPDILCISVKTFTNDEKIGIVEKNGATGKYDDWIFAWFMKRRIIEENNIRFDEDISLGEDDIFCVFFRNKAKSKERINMIAYYYRQREGSALHSDCTEDNIEKKIKSYGASLKYAKKFDFFYYIEEMIYRSMPNLMFYIAKQPKKQSKKYIAELKRNGLYPLPLKKEYRKEITSKTSIGQIIRRDSYTIKGYHLLRLYCCYLKMRDSLNSVIMNNAEKDKY